MKKLNWMLLTTFVLGGLMFQGCTSSSENVSEKREDLKEAREDLEEAKEDNMEAIAAFKKDQEATIAENEKNIQELKSKINSTKMDSKTYNEEIVKLELKNENLKVKIATYQGENKANWEAFKREFNHDMEEFGNAFKALTTKDVK